MTPYDAGAKAQKDGKPASSNPYDRYDKDQAYDHTQWARGWAASFTKARHDLPKEPDDEA